ncbi:hypothetical protein [Sulfurimonas sp. C5]|uniref:hypothetical protein n=1 Tax=Sulfurimonas sp. C5 TaxID=3036947 RepID=UPI002457E098|nr:hypothetical protein [Sulfurimonas sp. C5]MDH4944626.1 hypothetical protein [Sulfurimonas sp. C5]
MLLFGHRFIESIKFYHIFDIEDIKNTPSSSTLYLEYSEENLDIIKHLQKNTVPFVLSIKNITELVYASALGASYIAVSKKLAKTAQNIAENYLFDAKVLTHIEEEDEIEELALLGVDGVIFAQAIVKIS